MHESDLQDATTLGHEPEGIDARWIWAFAAVLVASVILAAGLMWLLLRGLGGLGAETTEAPQPQVPMPAGVPKLDANQVVEMQRLRVLEADLLDNYEWVDPATGAARIPIERAMAIAAEKGLGAINAAEAGPTAEAATTTEATTGLPPSEEQPTTAPTAEPSQEGTPTDE